MKVSREKTYKRDAEAVAWMMEQAGVKSIGVIRLGHMRWLVRGESDARAWAKFASAEAILENGKP